MKKTGAKKQTIEKSLEVMKERMEAFEHIAKALERLREQLQKIAKEKKPEKDG